MAEITRGDEMKVVTDLFAVFEHVREENLFSDQTEAWLPAWASFFFTPIFLFWEPEPAQKTASKKKYGWALVSTSFKYSAHPIYYQKRENRLQEVKKCQIMTHKK